MKIKTVVSIALLCLTAAMAERVSAQYAVRGKLGRHQKTIATTAVTVKDCSATHTYELTEDPGTPWAKIIGARRVTVAPGSVSADFKIEFDSQDLASGTYFGQAHGFCIDCATEPGCRPVKFTLDLRMEVQWSMAELNSIPAAAYVPDQVLATLSGEPKDVERAVKKLEKALQLKRLKEVQLSSVSKVLVLFRIKPNGLVPQLVGRLQQQPEVDFVQPNFIYRGSSAQTRDFESSQYGPRMIGADRAARYSTGKGILIALLDSGVDEHEDLKGKVIERKDFTGERNYRQDVHGTIMAGIISAIPHNSLGINGVAPDASIISIKVSKQAPGSTETTTDCFAITEELIFAMKMKANIANLSFGAQQRDPFLASRVRAAVKSGMVVVAAAGNSGPQGRPDYPAALDEVIAVSAVDRDKNAYASATVGDHIDLTAPGIGIHSTWPANTFRESEGSSEAAAHVTGVVALMLEKRPNSSPIEIKNLLEKTSTDLGPPGKDNVFGSGLVNVCKSLEALTGDGGVCSN